MATVETCHRAPRGVGIVERGGDYGQCGGALVPDGSEQRQEAARILVGRGGKRGAAYVTGLADIDRIASLLPLAFLTASAALVRSEMSRRSFSAKAAYRCSIEGSAF